MGHVQMRIESLNLSGFKNFEINTKINFQDEHSNFIFDTEEETKIFLFDTILAVLFGIPPGEKPLFKSEDPACKIFTGMLTMDFGGREFLIERDFETDFVAGIFFNSSGSKKPEPFFQGKDYVHSGTSRPFLTALRQYFEFCEKDAIRDICLRNPENENRTLAEILDIFYLLLNPGMKTLRIKNALDLFTPALSMMSDPGQQAPIPERIDYLRWIQASLIDLLKINNRSDQLVLDIRILDQLIKTVNNLISELETLTHTCRESTDSVWF